MRNVVIGFFGLLLVGCANAEDDALKPVAAETSPQVPALIYLQYLNQQAPQLLCQQDPSIACLRMPGELCQSAVVSSAERCGTELLQRWPESFDENETNAKMYAAEYRQCILRDWVKTFGLQPERLQACGLSVE